MSRHTQALATYRAKLVTRIINQHPELAPILSDIKLPWFRVRNAADDSDTAEVFIYDEIGGSFGVSAADFVQELSEITAANVDVRINSPGGDLFDSVAIYNALVKHNAKITVYVDALAASGASIISMAGDDIVMMVGSQMMIHDALGLELGNARDMRAMGTFLDRQSDNIADIYAHKAGGPSAEWRERMLAETWMFAQEAIELGLADRVYRKETDAEEDADAELSATAKAFGAKNAAELVDIMSAPEPDLEILMRQRHNLDNRGFKYSGRKAAPAPKGSTKTDDGIDRMVKLFQERMQ